MRVLVLLGIALLAGVVTALSPCVLPVLPLLLAGSAAGDSRWRPFAVMSGLVVSFTAFTLAGAAILSALGLPPDLLRTLAIVMLLVLAASLLSERVERRFDRARGTEPKRHTRRSRAMGAMPLSPVLALPAPENRFAMRKHHAHLSDEALVALVARGDEGALAELYDRVSRVAYGLALRVLRDERHAEDAVQEAFLQVWRNAASFRAERAKASTWILTLVHRRAVDLVRREERRAVEPLSEETELAQAQEGTEEAAWLRFERERVQSALKQLPDTQREALELAYYGGFSQSELAERLGVPLGTIKSRMFAGLARLREILDDSTQEGSWKPHFTS